MPLLLPLWSWGYFHGNVNHVFLFRLHQIHSNFVSLQQFEVMRTLWMDSTDVYFSAFILKLALEMSMLPFLTAHDPRTKETGVFVSWGPGVFPTLQMWMSFCGLTSLLALFPSSLLLGF